MRPAPPDFDPAVWTELEDARMRLANGEAESALDIYRRAFAGCVANGDHYHATVVAHMAGVAEANAAKKHDWNLAAVREADAVADRERVRQTYASNLNNLGMSFMQIGDREAALATFRSALAKVDDLPAGPYREQVRSAIERNLARLDGSSSEGSPAGTDRAGAP